MPSGQPVLSTINPIIAATTATGSTISLSIAANANLFNYLTNLEVEVMCPSVATAANGSSTICTITGVTGSPIIQLTGIVMAVGQVDYRYLTFPSPLKGSAVNTAMTFTISAWTNATFRVTAYYFVDY